MYISPDIPYYRSLEHIGRDTDLLFIQEDAWLQDTEVKYIIQRKHGLWSIVMVFIAIQYEMRILCRKIDAYSSRQKAITYAQIMQRGIRKDSRGTLKNKSNDFSFCRN